MQINSSYSTPQIKVLMYHRIVKNGQRKNPNFFDVRADSFRKQLQLLESFNFTPITFEDYHLHLEGKLTLPKKPIIITFDDGHTDMVDTALPVLQEFNMKAVVFVLGDRKLKYAAWDNKTETCGSYLMSEDQILTLRAEGYEIGAHSMTHPHLPELSNTKLQDEVMGSKHAVEDLLGEEIISFAYPFGSVDANVQALVAKSGFKYGCGVYTGPPKFAENTYDIRRLAINYNTGALQFLLRILTPYEYAEWMYGKVKSKRKNSKDADSKKTAIPDYDFTTTNNY